MTKLSIPPSRRMLAAIVAVVLSATLARAETPQPRITTDIDSSQRVTLAGSHPSRALAANEAGRVPAGTALHGITLVFSRTAAQQTALDALIAAQQNPASPQYHQWLTPAQFGAQFGMAASDLDAVQTWLRSQGFSIDSVSPSLNHISFSGTAGAVEAAFGTELHYFKSSDAQLHMAPATDLNLPAALASTVLAVENLSGFRPHSHVKLAGPQAKPDFTSSISGSHYLTPLDIATIYDINAAYSAGYTGTNQSIAVVGESAVLSTDITNFQTALGITAHAPTMVLVPNSGVSTINPNGASSGDDIESDLDLEYTSTIAKGATIYFVYTGNNTQQYNVFNALEYAITNKVANIITSSYGDCETDLGATNYAALNNYLAQGAAQGQTIISAAGDSGSTDCYGDTDLSGTAQEALAVDFPASSQYVTGMGGTEFSAAAVAVGNNTYFAAQGSTDVISSALSYIPETPWDDDNSSYGLSSGGGGVSTFTSRPSWQTGVSGIATGFYRLLPDISLDASNYNAPLAFCSSDIYAWSTGQSSSCTSGLRDSASEDLTIAGGTSFDAPIFAGMVALIAQSLNNTTGLGVVNPTLYELAANPTTYATAFHDITSGSNACLAGAGYCSTAGASEFFAGTGYDEASGLGSVDLYNLLKAWPTATAASTRGTFTVAAASLSVASGSTGTSTVTVTPAGGYTGTIAWSISSSPALSNACYSIPNVTVTGTAAVSTTLTVQALSTGCATANFKAFGGTLTASKAPAPKPFAPAPATAAVAALLLAGYFGRRSRKLRSLVAVAILGVIGFAATGCSNGSTSAVPVVTTTTTTTTTTNASAGTYTLTLTGTDTLTSTITASTTLTLTIH